VGLKWGDHAQNIHDFVGRRLRNHTLNRME